jgi:hypothetical protein
MHRMGAGGSKMRAFDAFCASVDPLTDKILKAQSFAPTAMNEDAWATLKQIFSGLRIHVGRPARRPVNQLRQQSRERASQVACIHMACRIETRSAVGDLRRAGDILMAAR